MTLAPSRRPATLAVDVDRGDRRRWITLAVLCMSLLIIVMDNTILNVAIPSLITDLGASNSEIQWIIDSYMLVFAGLLLTTGSLSRPLRPQGRPASRHRAVRHRIGVGGALRPRRRS